jgi:dihydroneopterin aldolase
MTNLACSNDILSVKELQTETILGVYDWERVACRPVIINMDIRIETIAAAKSDNINETLDYAQLIDKVDDFVRSQTCQLIETLAHNIAMLVLSEYFCHSVKIEVIKPNIISKVKQISICIERHK